MSKHHEPLVIANWKMNPVTLVEAKTILTSVKTLLKKQTGVQVVVAPPALFLLEMKKVLGASAIALGVQSIHPAPFGAQTGEVSAPMAATAGASFVLIGHSERRALGETDAMVAEKITAVQKAKLTPIICIGERERDTQGNFFLFIEAQIKALLSVVPKTRFKDIVIAYEPIWAIGTGKTATAEDVNEMRLFIQKIVTKYGDRSAAQKIRIIYGGSVTGETALLLKTGGGVDGFLVGGASLRPQEFAKIVSSVV